VVRLRETLPAIRNRIAMAAHEAGRAPEDVRLVAVTKGHPPDAVSAALSVGLVDLGENRVESLEEKARLFEGRGVRWHMIGHLQSRKSSRAASHAALIHSVDSVKLAARLGRYGVEHGSVPVLFQVNTSGESAKFGFALDSAEEEILAALDEEGIDGRGLMTMAPFAAEERVVRDAFRRLRELRDGIRANRADFGSELSMGMTNDLDVAVQEGSTMVRIGTALFGARPGQ
jgi:pyridoxal phosphate enzyme (YggS family)